MKRWLVWTAVLLMLCFVVDAFAGGDDAGGEKPRKKRTKEARVAKEGRARERVPQAFGQVKSVDVDGGKIVVAVRKRGQREPQEVTYVINAETKVRMGGQEKTLADVAAGKGVQIRFKEAEDGGNAVATLITIRMPMSRGTVKKVNAATKTIVVSTRVRGKREAEDVTFTLGDDVKILQGREEKTLADLTEGARVMVMYQEADGGKTAVTVRLVPQRRREGAQTAPRERRQKKEEKAEE